MMKTPLLTVGDVFYHLSNCCTVWFIRIQYLDMIGLNDLKYKTTGIGTILAQTVCKYLKPLAYPDQIIVGAKVKSIGKSSVVMEYIIVSEKLGVSATGEEAIVIYDYNNSKKAELPLVIIEAIEKIDR